jgi:hypothetical protein
VRFFKLTFYSFGEVGRASKAAYSFKYQVGFYSNPNLNKNSAMLSLLDHFKLALIIILTSLLEGMNMYLGGYMFLFSSPSFQVFHTL